jgi:hypothetical protein
MTVHSELIWLKFSRSSSCHPKKTDRQSFKIMSGMQIDFSSGPGKLFVSISANNNLFSNSGFANWHQRKLFWATIETDRGTQIDFNLDLKNTKFQYVPTANSLNCKISKFLTV